MSRYCPKCGKAKKACICRWIKPVETDIELIILQHPSEVKHAKGTAKILTLSLSNSRLFVGEDFTSHCELNHLLSDPCYHNLLIYPREDATPIRQEASGNLSGGKKLRLLLIDGTWRKAFKMYQLSSNLHSLDAVDISEGMDGNYRIRKAPSETSLSTVEAGYHALTTLDTKTDFSSLITTFEKMIDFQISQMPDGTYEKNYRSK
ncbi:DTW domain-containing protein [Vibrio hannami]|uniref:tRNA-uridine aminocarboxypropyltransferase n=1 Tax=Vibrio hannami TaxID=2717094 RepID=UPI00240F3123|nr:DTW domain-containing protein [Vibrio hannami]MDG3087554.1 DTW domain-containing protein [Vibrio hannami]